MREGRSSHHPGRGVLAGPCGGWQRERSHDDVVTSSVRTHITTADLKREPERRREDRFKQARGRFPNRVGQLPSVRDGVLTLLFERRAGLEGSDADGITVTTPTSRSGIDFVKTKFFGGSDKNLLAAAKNPCYSPEAEVRSDVIRPRSFSYGSGAAS